MKNNILTIIKKEFARFFGDKRMVITTIFLPGILIYVLYSFMGQGLTEQFSTDDDYVYSVYIENLPDSLSGSFDGMSMNVNTITQDEVDKMETSIEDKDTDLLVIFPEDFDAKVAAYDSLTAQDTAPEIQMYYNSTKTESSSAYQIVYEMLDTYESMLANKFDVNAGDGAYNLASEKDTTGQIFSMMLPMLMMMFLFSGCMAIAPEAIAGEKERGTIATLLVTPMKRSQLAIGKIVSLGIIGLLSGISSFIGTMLSLPNMMGSDSSMSTSVYQATDYMLLLFVILTTVLVIVGTMAVISALAKSVKEATTAITPLMIVIMVVAISSMMGDGAPKAFYWYLIPFYNSVQCMNGIFSFTYVPMNIVVCLVSNLVYTFVLAGLLTKMFDSEKIMYL